MIVLQNIHISVDKEQKIAEIKVQNCKILLNIVVPLQYMTASNIPTTSLSHILSI